MAVDTASKRSSALGFGSPWRSGTRPPSGSIGEFDRAALLGCYYTPAIVVTVLPSDGWNAGVDRVVWSAGVEDVSWSADSEEVSWPAGVENS